MATFSQGDIIRVPFPYTDKATRQRRPALIVSRSPIGDDAMLLWVVMVTSAANRGWPGDISIREFARSGLPAPSIIRPAKLATIETRYADRLGTIDTPTLDSVMTFLRANLFVPSNHP